MTRKYLVLFCMLATSQAFAAGFTVESQSFVDGGRISLKNVWSSSGCAGQNISPQIEWHYEPIGTQSFAVTIKDPDAPAKGGWWHWAVFNIPASVSQLEEGASTNTNKLPQDAVEGVNDFGTHGYGGPCPPAGDKPHHYVLTVYALPGLQPDFSPNSSDIKIGEYLRQNALASASVTGIYSR